MRKFSSNKIYMNYGVWPNFEHTYAIVGKGFKYGVVASSYISYAYTDNKKDLTEVLKLLKYRKVFNINERW